MGLINAEEDDWEVIEAEDAAIAAAEAGPKPEPGDLTALMEALRGSEEPPRVAEPDRGDGRGKS